VQNFRTPGAEAVGSRGAATTECEQAIAYAADELGADIAWGRVSAVRDDHPSRNYDRRGRRVRSLDTCACKVHVSNACALAVRSRTASRLDKTATFRNYP
jgi:hypothetical protein